MSDEKEPIFFMGKFSIFRKNEDPKEIQEIKKRISEENISGISIEEIEEFNKILRASREHNTTVICPKCGHEFEIED